MMKQEIDLFQIRDDIINRLQLFEMDTAKIFNRMGDIYPALLMRIRKGVSEAERTLQSVRLSSEIADDSGHGAFLAEVKHEVSDATDQFNSHLEKDKALLEGLGKGITRIDAMSGLISEIREDSTAMELIALNAMTAAIKAGKAGGAFSYITDELKRLSTRTINNTTILTDLGQQTSKNFTNLKTQIETAQSRQLKLIRNFEENLEQNFEILLNGAGYKLTQLDQMITIAGTITDPLVDIMENLQHQDIIRQSIDHMILSLNNMPVITEETKDDLLDELYFLKQVTELTLSVVHEIQSKVEACNTNFTADQQKISEILKEYSEIHGCLIKGCGDQDSFLIIYDQKISDIKQLMGELSRNIRSKEKINNGNKRMLTEIGTLYDGFKEFSRLVDRFQNINIASKIEIAKQPILKNMTDTVREMGDLTTNIEKNIEDALKIIKLYLKDTKTAVEATEELFEEETQYLDLFNERMEKHFDKLETLHSRLTSMVGSFSIISEGFLDEFRAGETELDKIRILFSDLEEIRRSLIGIQKDAELKMVPLLNGRDDNDWSIQNNRLKQIIEEFTILKHKEEAAEIGNFDIETGKDEGDITFF